MSTEHALTRDNPKTRKNKDLRTKNPLDKKVVVERNEDKFKGKQVKKTFRSNLKSMLELIQELDKEGLKITTKHEKVLKKTEFWNFIHVLKEGRVSKMECVKSPKALEYIISCYASTNAFKIGGQTLKTDANSLAVIFGMKRSIKSEEDKKMYGPREDPNLFTSDLYIRYFKNDDPKKSDEKLMKSDIVKAIKNVLGKNNKENEFVQLLVLYMCCTTFFTNCGGMYINYKFLNCVKSIDAINSVSWPDLIHEHLMESIAALYNKPYSVRGCTIYLLYWLFEHIKSIERKDEKNFPRFATWNLHDASCNVESKWKTISKDQVSEDFVTSFTDVEKEFCCFEKVANRDYGNMEDSLDSMTASNTLLQMMYKQRGTVIEAKDKIIANLESEAKEKDRTISALKSAVEEKDKIIAALSEEYKPQKPQATQVRAEPALNMVNVGETTPEIANDSANSEHVLVPDPHSIHNQLEPSENDTDDKKNVYSDSTGESVVAVEQQIALETEGSLPYCLVLLNQGSVNTSPTNVIDVDNEDEKEITAAHPCSGEGKELPQVSTDETLNASEKCLKRPVLLRRDEECVGSSDKDLLTPCSRFCSTPKRFRASVTAIGHCVCQKENLHGEPLPPSS